MKSKLASSCLLKSLNSSKIKEALPFLDIQENEVVFEQTHFSSCCEGSGLIIAPDRSRVFKCELRTRIQAIQKIIDAYSQTWDKLFELNIFSGEEFLTYWSWFILYGHRGVYKGYLIQKSSENLPWTLATMVRWRLGLKTFVFCLKRHKIRDFTRFIEESQEDTIPPIVFLEIEEGIWNLQKKENITFIISWCEKHLWPLWVFDRNLPQQEKGFSKLAQNQRKPISKQLQGFNKIIAQAKHKPFAEWLEKETLSKLSSLCDPP